jgi:hypothetical protein
MAVRDDSVIRGSLYASLIVLAFSLLLNIWFMMSSNWAKQGEAKAKSDASGAQESLRKETDRVSLLKAMVGSKPLSAGEFTQLETSVSGDAEMEKALKDYKAAIALLPDDANNKNAKSLSGLYEYILNALRDRNKELLASEKQRIQQADAADEIRKNQEKATNEAIAKRNELADELTKERNSFAEDRKGFESKSAELSDKLNETVSKAEADRRTASELQQKLNNDIVQANRIIAIQQDELAKLRREEFEAPQGKIVQVLRGGELVWVNLGSADGLRPGVGFSVIPADEIRVSEAKPKAQLEVTRVTGAHLAEARVVSTDDLLVPVVEEDKVYSPMWAPGRPVKFALAGRLDINNDGQDDIAKLKSLIEAGGGQVVATLDMAGNRTGKLGSDVRWLVMGDVPELTGGDGDADLANEKFTKALTSFRTEAFRQGIGVIDIDKMLGYLKNADESLTIPLGRAATESTGIVPRAAGVQGRWDGSVADIYMREKRANTPPKDR